MNGWTKGPWRAEGPDMFGDWNIIPPDDALAVAAVVSNLRPAEEVMANAELVAAAPDLAEALEGMLTRYVDMVNSGDAGFWNPEEEVFVIEARAALRRAKGEA